MKKKLDKRKEKLMDLALKSYSDESIIIYFLLRSNKLDNIINDLDDVKVIPKNTSIIENGFLTSEEQLLKNMKYIIYNFDKEFWFIRSNRNIIIDLLINSSSAKELLYSKKYTGDNEYIDYFFLEFQKILINNFLDIINLSDNKDYIFKKYSIKDNDDIKNIYELLKLICLCNCTSFNLVYLFDNKIDTNIDFYTMQLDFLLEKTEKLKKKALPFASAFYY